MGAEYLGSTKDTYLTRLLFDSKLNISVKTITKHDRRKHNYMLLDKEVQKPINLHENRQSKESLFSVSFSDWWRFLFTETTSDDIVLPRNFDHQQSRYSYSHSHSQNFIKTIQQFIQQFDEIYKYIDSINFDSINFQTKNKISSVKHILKQSRLFDLTQVDCETYLHEKITNGKEEHRIYLSILDELVTGLLREYNGQTYDINALACMNALANIVQQETVFREYIHNHNHKHKHRKHLLYQIEKGNDELVSKLFDLHDIIPFIGYQVTQIIELENKKYSIKYKQRNLFTGYFKREAQEITAQNIYDFVIIATPFENGGIKLIPYENNHSKSKTFFNRLNNIPQTNYKKVFITIVSNIDNKLHLDSDYFGFDCSNPKHFRISSHHKHNIAHKHHQAAGNDFLPISTILVSNKNYAPMFWYLEIYSNYYKIVGPHVLSKDQFTMIFNQSRLINQVQNVTRKLWSGGFPSHKYRINPRHGFGNFKVLKDANIFYLNGFDNIMMSVEITLIQARFVAKLVANQVKLQP